MYKISKGQVWVISIGLICLWLFFLVEAGSYSSDWWGGFGSILTPIALVFYIIGWKNYRRKNDEDSKLLGGFIGKFFKYFKKAIIPLVIVGVGVAGVFWYVDYQEGGGKVDGLHSIRQAELDEFVGRYNRYGKHLENAEQCKIELVEGKLGGAKVACQVKYDTALASYRDCKEDMPWSSHYDCIHWFNSDYESIDCSDETLTEKIKREDFACYATVNREVSYLISFEEKLIDDYLEDLPVNKYSLSSGEMQELYSKLPSEAFNDKTQVRFNEYVESKGYSIE